MTLLVNETTEHFIQKLKKYLSRIKYQHLLQQFQSMTIKTTIQSERKAIKNIRHTGKNKIEDTHAK